MKLLTSEANLLFNNGFYEKALKLYQEAASLYGENLYIANIAICKSKIKDNFNNNIKKINKSKSVKNNTLKSYVRKKIIKIGKKNESYITNNNSNISISCENPFLIECEIHSSTMYLLSLKCETKKQPSLKGLVAKVVFFDGNGRAIEKQYSGMHESKKYGSYFYIETQDIINAKTKNYKIMTPSDAVKIKIIFYCFETKESVTLNKGFDLAPVKGSSVDQVERSIYIDEFKKILIEAEDIPESNGSEYFTKHSLCVGVIGDVYMYNFYKDVFESVYYLSPSNYNEILNNNLDVIIYTTCWKGINNEEWKGIKFRSEPKTALDEILDYAKKNEIKTVFQSIEDPSNFEYFLSIAEKFDYILTTDTDSILCYKEKLGHDRVFFGEYGVNPQFNNPIGSRRNIRNAAFFAGSYPKRYKERCNDMEVIFDSIIESQGEMLIADRNYGAESEDLLYPKRFQANILPPVSHALLQKVHKLFRFNLNFNSIKQSPSMCAMRVYELQAQGNGLISNYANSVYNKFPNLRIVPYKQDLRFDFCTDENWEEYQSKISNIREVINSKTSYQVVSTMLKNIGLKANNRLDITVIVICKQKTNNIINNFNTQSYPNKLLIEESDLKRWDEIKKNNEAGYFCWFNEENCYEKYYINDLINAFKYTNSHFVTKNAYFNSSGNFNDGKQHEYTELCRAKALSVFSAKHLKPDDLNMHGEMEEFILPHGYSIDPFEINFASYLRSLQNQPQEFQISVIVPVYNNGVFLLSKCIPSLQRNKIWSKMEVILVDDGSADPQTIDALKYLERAYSNIIVKYNNDGGSGSASRPRNQGIEMARSDFITFLDPDNEIAPGAYDLLLEIYFEVRGSTSVRLDFISGFHVKVAEKVNIIGRHTTNRISIIKNPKEKYLDVGRFPVIATQSGIIAKSFLLENNIRFVEGAAGQDTLFGWELISQSMCCGFAGDPYIIYYADREGSVTNLIDASYFQKKLILEKMQVDFLKKNNLFEIYIKNHLNNFLKNWYLIKLSNVIESDYTKSLSLLMQICGLYNKELIKDVNGNLIIQ